MRDNFINMESHSNDKSKFENNIISEKAGTPSKIEVYANIGESTGYGETQNSDEKKISTNGIRDTI